MTAAELLRNAAPPADDGLIDKAIAELDVRIFEWVDALKSAQTQLRSALAPVKPMRPSARLFEDTSPPSALSSGLSAAAAAAHIPSPPPMPSEWTAPPPTPASMQAPAAASPAAATPGMPAEMPWPSQPSPFGGHGASTGGGQPQPHSWPEPPSSQSFRQADAGASPAASTGVMQWPSSTNAWPAAGAGGQAGGGAPQSLEWPTWSPTDTTAASTTSAKKGATPAQAPTSAPAAKKPAKGPKAMPEGPSPEERAQKAAAEEALLSELEDAIARRVRLLRRLDPDTPIEKLIDKARQGQAEASSGPQAREDKSSSWWRRK